MKMSQHSIWFRAAAGGFLLRTAFESLRQDWYGKELYIKLVQENWLPADNTVPMAIIIAALGLYIICAAIKDENSIKGFLDWISENDRYKKRDFV